MIRRANKEDIDDIKRIYKKAKEYMIKDGNPTQWPSFYPGDIEINEDIENGNLYVGEVNDNVCFCFSFIIGIDTTYINIENGNWLNDDEYGAVHRVASDGSQKHVFDKIMNYCINVIDNIRIDTHEDNKTMRRNLLRFGFKECGIIYVLEKSPRIAYHYVKK